MLPCQHCKWASIHRPLAVTSNICMELFLHAESTASQRTAVPLHCVRWHRLVISGLLQLFEPALQEVYQQLAYHMSLYGQLVPTPTLDLLPLEAHQSTCGTLQHHKSHVHNRALESNASCATVTVYAASLYAAGIVHAVKAGALAGTQLQGSPYSGISRWNVSYV